MARASASDAVAFPLTTDEVSAVVKIAARHRVPIVPFGAGSSLEGHVNAIHGGISVDLSRMNRILRVSVEDLDCQVEAGITHRQLNKALSGSGVHFLRGPRRRRHNEAAWPPRVHQGRRPCVRDHA